MNTEDFLKLNQSRLTRMVEGGTGEMKRIYKYILEPTEFQSIELPEGAEVLSAEEQQGNIVFYALINPETTETWRHHFLVYGTGHDINQDMANYRFLDTVKMNIYGNLMFHIFVSRTAIR